MMLLRKLVSDVCPATTEVAPDLRLGPTLPHASLIAAARDFDDLGDIGKAFEEFRVTHRSNLHSSSAVAMDAPTTLRAKKNQHERIVHHVASSRPSPPQQPQQHHQLQQQHQQQQQPTASSWTAGMSFVRCLLTLADPTSQLLSASDAERCLAAFIERATASIAREAERAAKAYVQTCSPGLKVADVVESLSDPLTTLSDAGLNDAAVLHMARLLRVSLVVRRGAAGAPCVVFSASDGGSSGAAAFVRWNDATGKFEIADGAAFSAGTLAGVQSGLLSEDGGALLARLKTMVPFERHKVAVLRDACECAAVVVGGSRPSKAAYAEALIRLVSPA